MTVVRISAPLAYGAHIYRPGSFVEVDSALALRLVSQGKAEMGAETLANLVDQPMDLTGISAADAAAAQLEAEQTQLDRVLRESAEARAPEKQQEADDARAAAQAQAQQDAEAQAQRGWALLKSRGLFGD